MTLPPDIERAVQIIDQRIAILQQTKAMILQEFSDEQNDWKSPFHFIEPVKQGEP